VPLACVDLLPWRRTASGVEVLLIERRQRSDPTGWALVGGRIMHGETIAQAAARHLKETLGAAASMRPRDFSRPDRVAEYRRGSKGDGGGTFDLDRHSVALNYCVEPGGEPRAGGEALGLRWFDGGELPAAERVVFGQHGLIAELAGPVRHSCRPRAWARRMISGAIVLLKLPV